MVKMNKEHGNLCSLCKWTVNFKLFQNEVYQSVLLYPPYMFEGLQWLNIDDIQVQNL
jgi:hypothetical protein